LASLPDVPSVFSSPQPNVAMKFSLVLLSVAASAMADMANNHIKRDHHAHAAAALHKKDVTPEQVEKRNDDEQLVKRDSYTGVATYYEVTTNA